jgi:hypothetical protein
VKTGSEKGWSTIQTYLKKGKEGEEGEEEEEEEEEVVGMRADYGGEEERVEEKEELMQQGIGDLLGLEEEEPRQAGLNGETRKEHKKKSVRKDDGPPLISFDEDPMTTPIPAHTPEESPRSRRKAKTGGGGYGSVGYGSTTAAPTSAKTGSKAADWSGDWGEEWLGGRTEPVDNSGSKSGGGWDEWNADGWNTESGWSTVDLKKD